VSPVAVGIVDAGRRADAPGATLTYEVRNDGDATVWLVDDGWLVWRRENRRIELGFQRAPMQPGVEPFGYFNPQLVPVAPGDAVRRTVELSWPQRLDGLWNAEDEAAPPPGEYDVAVRVGYGESESPPPPTRGGQGVEAPVLAWQNEAVSPPVRLAL
jgi:hypothetical protein